MPGSLALEPRRPTLEGGRDAFRPVGGRQQQRRQIGLEPEPSSQREIARGASGFFRIGERVWRGPAQGSEYLGQRLARNTLVPTMDQAAPARFRRRKNFPEEEQLERSASTHQ